MKWIMLLHFHKKILPMALSRQCSCLLVFCCLQTFLSLIAYHPVWAQTPVAVRSDQDAGKTAWTGVNRSVDTPQVDPEPAILEYVSGDGQTGVVGQLLAEPLVVRVLDAQRQPVAGIDVTFHVVNGNGSINAMTTQSVNSNSSGQASVRLTLGQTAGQNNNIVVASVAGLQDLITFTGSALAGVPAIMVKIVDSDMQYGRTGQLLANPFQVRILDQYANPVAGHSVTFAISGTSGTLNDRTSTIDLSGENGLAQAVLRFGDLSGLYSVTCSSQYQGIPLKNSPLQFTAIAASDPAKLQTVSGDSSVGLINQKVIQPLRVKVMDSQGYPVVGYYVSFVARRGGHFDGPSLVRVATNADGIAEVKPVLSSTPGLYNNVFEAQAFSTDGQHLAGSPRRFYITAKKSFASQLRLISGDGQSGQTRRYLNKPLIVRAEDTLGQPVLGQEVGFQVVKGSGLLGNGLAKQVTLKTDPAGLVAVNYQLGDEIGIGLQVVSVEANDGVMALRNSPLTLSASALYGRPDSLQSEIVTSAPVVADGRSVSRIVVRLFDRWKNPVAGEQVYLTAEGNACSIDQPSGMTDSHGEISGGIRSTRSGSKIIRALVGRDNMPLAAQATAEFLAGPAKRISMVSGNYQDGVIKSALAQPIVIKVLDENDNPVPAVAVSWQPSSGSGRTEPAANDWTNPRGEAKTKWILGTIVGTQQLRVSVFGAEDAYVYAQAGLSSQAKLSRVRGDGQFALPNDVFNDSLVVAMRNGSNAPISGVPILFTVLEGNAVIEGSAMPTSNSYGFAGIRLRAGSALGGVQVRASADDSLQVFFNLAVAQSIPDQLLAISGDGLSGSVQSVIKDLTVQVLDPYRQPIANVPVYFSCLTEGGAILSDQPVLTANNGLASTDVQLGRNSGSYYVTASSLNLKNSPILYKLQAISGPALQMVDHYGNFQEGRPEQWLLYPLKIGVYDLYENGVPNVPVKFTITAGGGLLGNDPLQRTDSTGIVTMFWRLGKSGYQTILVESEQLPGQSIEYNSRITTNAAPVIHAPTDTTIEETHTLAFTLGAVDPEGDSWNLGLSSMPKGATFDSVDTRLFLWTPDQDQEGFYLLTATARDEFGAVSRKTIAIRVTNKNRPPMIQATPDTHFVAVQYYRPYTFSVTAADVDEDPLTFVWRLAGRMIGQESSLQLIPNPSLQNPFTLTVMVSDGQDSVCYDWNLAIPSSIGDRSMEPTALPRRLRLVQNYPNPFNPETTISYEVEARQKVEIVVLNVNGQHVTTLFAGEREAGFHHVRWNGRDAVGRPLPSGLYFCTLIGKSRRDMIKMMMLK